MTDVSGLQPGAICLVTGASGGIGQAVAESLLHKGFRVICAARRADRMVELFGSFGEQAHIVALDVTDGPAVAGLIDRLPAAWREIEVLVANAGSDIGGRQSFVDTDMGDWASTVEVNVTGVLRVCHAVLPGMQARQRGHIVTLGSIAGLETYASGAVYGASKYAVRAFTQALRKDFKDSPIRITEILPGMVRTGFAEARFHGDATRAEQFYDSFPATLAAEDIAAALLFALEQPPHVNIAQIVVTPTADK